MGDRIGGRITRCGQPAPAEPAGGGPGSAGLTLPDSVVKLVCLLRLRAVRLPWWGRRGLCAQAVL